MSRIPSRDTAHLAPSNTVERDLGSDTLLASAAHGWHATAYNFSSLLLVIRVLVLPPTPRPSHTLCLLGTRIEAGRTFAGLQVQNRRPAPEPIHSLTSPERGILGSIANNSPAVPPHNPKPAKLLKSSVGNQALL